MPVTGAPSIPAQKATPAGPLLQLLENAQARSRFSGTGMAVTAFAAFAAIGVLFCLLGFPLFLLPVSLTVRLLSLSFVTSRAVREAEVWLAQCQEPEDPAIAKDSSPTEKE